MPPPGRPSSRQASPSSWVRGGANSGVCEDEHNFHGAPAGARYGLRPDPADQAEPTRCARVSVVVSARSGIVRRASSPAVGEIGRRTVSASFDDIAPHLLVCKTRAKTMTPLRPPWQEPVNLDPPQDAFQTTVVPPELDGPFFHTISWPCLACLRAFRCRAAASRRFPCLSTSRSSLVARGASQTPCSQLWRQAAAQFGAVAETLCICSSW